MNLRLIVLLVFLLQAVIVPGTFAGMHGPSAGSEATLDGHCAGDGAHDHAATSGCAMDCQCPSGNAPVVVGTTTGPAQTLLSSPIARNTSSPRSLPGSDAPFRPPR